MQGRLIPITEEVCKQAEALAANGLNMEQIARSLGMGASCLYAKQNAFPEFKEAIENGRAKGVAAISNALFQSAKKGSVAAQIFYLKNRSPDTWKDARYMPEDEQRTTAAPVTVTIVDGRAESDPASS